MRVHFAARLRWRALRARYRDQATELRAIRASIGKPDLVCDIGANKGSYLYWLSRWAGRVVAFEPQADLASYLRASFKNAPNVSVEAKGVYSKTTVLDLHIPAEGAAGASVVQTGPGRIVKVPVVALDDYFSPSDRISLMKIDVEGAELDVFRGADRILRQDAPVLIFECESRHLKNGTVLDVLTHLKELGYAGRFINRRRLIPVDKFDPEIHQPALGGRFWDAPDYCNNFIFTKR
jgi:FkbM family methyltransferase